MSGFYVPPLANVGPLFVYDGSMSPMAKRLYRYMRPLDQPVNVFVNSDSTVTTDFSLPIAATSENGEVTSSRVSVLYPWFPNETPEVGPSEGAEGGPFGPPQPYATIFDATSGQLVITKYALTTYIKYWFRGGIKYPSISANLVTILTNAGYALYLI